MTPEESLRRFESVVSQPEDQINLAEAALLIATDEYPDLDIAHYLHTLDLFADEIRPHFDASATGIEQVAFLNEYIFNTLGFRGNRDEYYDPRNSYLNDVIERGTGIPITLSVVYMEIGRRLGCPLEGVAMPGHFIVKWKSDNLVILIDVFDNGHVIGQFRLPQPTDVLSRLTWVQTATSRQILVRMLNNLRSIFAESKSYERVLRLLERLLILEPDASEILRDAALTAYQIKAYRRASNYLTDYLARFPNSNQANQLKALSKHVDEILLRLN
jgi:regulator of sirC expression with transglutaminase-like and TPR domain